MYQHSPEDIKGYLRQKDVQRRIQDNMQNARENATVTISRAASLFGFTEVQLREWEKRGLLKTERSPLAQDGKSTTGTGHRKYSPAELDKLAIIHELIKVAGYSAAAIPPEVDDVWQNILFEQQMERARKQEQQVAREQMAVYEGKHLPLDQRVEQTDREVFWRYFVSQALRLSLLLLCEDIPETIAALILPLETPNAYDIITSPADLPNVGPSLIGWLGNNQSFYTFLEDRPSFEVFSDFRLEKLVPFKGEAQGHDTFIAVQRKARQPILSEALVNTIRRLLEPVYSHVADWRSCFDLGMRDWLYQAVNFKNPNSSDDVLNGLANMVVELGGKTDDGKDHWKFCSILLPDDPALPLQQRSLLVQAQSDNAPHVVARTIVSPETESLSLKAFQSGSIISRPEISSDDNIIAYHAQEGPIGSAIAIPVSGEDGISTGTIYVASEAPYAFSKDDQRLLRLMSRMIEELLLTYRVRQQATSRLIDLINKPTIVDTTFKDFSTENDFISDLESLLTNLRDSIGYWSEPKRKEDVPVADRSAKFQADMLTGEAVSFIAIEIDNQSARANKYGDRVTRNLSKAVGDRIQGQLTPFEKYKGRKLYHVQADRYYLFLDGILLDEAQAKAEKLRLVLKGPYRVAAKPTSIGRPILRDEMLELPNVSVHLGVASYPYTKVRELLQRSPFADSVSTVRSLIINSMDVPLDVGRREGGDIVVSFYPEVWGYASSPSQDSPQTYR